MSSTIQRRLASVALALAVATGAACTDATGPDDRDVAGTYEATRILIIENGIDTLNLLGQGVELTLVLDESGDTFGRLFVPGGNDDGSDVDLDLDGFWEYDGGFVYFDVTEDVFLNSLPFRVSSSQRLRADRSFQSSAGTFRYVVDLEKD